MYWSHTLHLSTANLRWPRTIPTHVPPRERLEQRERWRGRGQPAQNAVWALQMAWPHMPEGGKGPHEREWCLSLPPAPSSHWCSSLSKTPPPPPSSWTLSSSSSPAPIPHNYLSSFSLISLASHRISIAVGFIRLQSQRHLPNPSCSTQNCLPCFCPCYVLAGSAPSLTSSSCHGQRSTAAKQQQKNLSPFPILFSYTHRSQVPGGVGSWLVIFLFGVCPSPKVSGAALLSALFVPWKKVCSFLAAFFPLRPATFTEPGNSSVPVQSCGV